MQISSDGVTRPMLTSHSVLIASIYRFSTIMQFDVNDTTCKSQA